jgi:hypothetical protein
MAHALPYAYEKLTGAIESLATSPTDIQTRLGNALLGIHTLSQQDFPPGELRDAWDRLERQKSAIVEKGDGLEKACQKISDLEACEAARSIFSLHQMLIGAGHAFYVDPQAA